MSYQQQEQENMQRNDQLLAMLEKLAKDVENLKEENIAQKHQITDLVNKNKELTQEISELKNKPEKTGKELFNQELLDIAANGAPDAQFETLFILGANINITNKSGDTVVHVALRNTQQRTAAFLLSKAPHLLTTANQEGYDPLQLVAHLGQAELFGWLYDTAKGMEYFKNNDTFEKLYDVATAEIKAILASKKLIEATKAEKMTDVELALNKGADVHYRTSDGDTALHKAVEYKNVKIIELLLAHGASTMPYDALHRNVLEVAKLTRSKTVTEKIAMAFLFESAKKDSRPYIVRVVTNEVEQELWASRGGVFAKDREVLLKQDGDRLTYYVAGNQSGTIAFSELGISSYEESGDLRDKILAITAAHEHTPLDVKIALNAGADINAIDEKDGLPALIKAVIAGKQENVKALIAAGADININAKDGQTALHKAIIAGNDDMMRILIDAGANVNAVDPADGLSPLLKAVIAGKQDIVASLIEKGANLIATDPKNGEIALHKAVANAQYAIMELLLMGHAKAKNTIHVADKEGKTPCDRAGDTRITTKKKHNLLLAAYMTQHFGKYKAQCQDKDGAKILSSSSNSFLSAIGSAANAPQTTANTQQEAEKATTSAGMSLNSSH